MNYSEWDRYFTLFQLFFIHFLIIGSLFYLKCKYNHEKGLSVFYTCIIIALLDLLIFLINNINFTYIIIYAIMLKLKLILHILKELAFKNYIKIKKLLFCLFPHNNSLGGLVLW